MSDGPGGNKTVFRPSPLQGRKAGGQPPAPPAQQGWGAPPPPAQQQSQGQWGAPPPTPSYQPQSGYDAMPTMSREQPPAMAALAPSRLGEDDVPLPSTPRAMRNVMLGEAGPVLALAAGMRAGRVRTPLPQFHREATRAITQFERALGQYPEEMRQRAKYAVCATIDDVAQNLPGMGNDGAEWARRSMVVQFFRENIGGDRFWQLVDDMLRTPSDNRDLIELFHACLAAGFEGRFRVMPDGKRRLHEIMARLQGALEHVRGLSMLEMSPKWRGETAPLGKVGLWTYVAIAAAAAAALLLLVYIILRLLLMSAGEAPADRLAGAMPDDRLRLSRDGGEAPAVGPSAQAGKLQTFLKPEIDGNKVTIEEDAQTVRVRTTVGQLFQSGSDQLEAGQQALFQRVAQAVANEKGSITVEGHADSDKINSLAFPDNQALSQARANTVAGIIKSNIADPGRVTAKGMGETVPIASNDTAQGKTRNRRVEVIVPRVY
ncbi:MAG: yiaD 2 [Sphingomonas bacterium]|uniref:type IVB secretion system protein IcmH/DotU n=1 Tax=Sphingomonas bacterium TaxID=1895847 RepID=UPI0026228A57|nr:type IVB secretion system protein IcmH/DotU [Sphingomonas bacterium]MDB5695989.1 yiaD 2 [Sphingomonas bacterium]